MNAAQRNEAHRLLFLDGGRLDTILFGASEVRELQEKSARRRAEQEYPTCECWSCGELRPDDLKECPTCEAECTPF